MLNGAAARTCQPGDAVIIVAKASMPMDLALLPRPRVAIFDRDNRITELLEYRAGRDDGLSEALCAVAVRGVMRRMHEFADLRTIQGCVRFDRCITGFHHFCAMGNG